jgi:hypothetical protein
MKIKIKAFLLILFLIFSVEFAQAQACEPITFSNVPPDTFNCMKSQLIDYGINVPSGNSGELSGHGITGNFVWDEESKLTIQITKKPRFISCGTADNEIGKFVQECQIVKENLG